MHDHKTSFLSPMSPEEILDQFRELAYGKGWKVTEDEPDRVHVQSGPTIKAAGQDMDVRVAPHTDGTQVHVEVKSKHGLLQVVDWGEAADFYRQILARLQAPNTVR